MNANYMVSVNDLKYADHKGIKISTHIGLGTYSNVYKAKHKSTLVTLKVTQNKRCKRHFIDQQRDVIIALKEKNHKNIIKHLDIFENPDQSQTWIVMEWLTAVDLCYKLEQNDGPFTEELAKNYFKQLIDGLEFMHTMGIVHRDIKLSNILITTGEGEGVVKYIDFGFAKKVQIRENSAFCCSFVGTELYMAPEILSKAEEEYDAFKSDIYSLGVLLFAMLYQCYPFDNSTKDIFIDKKLSPIEFTQNVNTSESVKQLIRDMVCGDSQQRVYFQQIKDSFWLKDSKDSKDSIED